MDRNDLRIYHSKFPSIDIALSTEPNTTPTPIRPLSEAISVDPGNQPATSPEKVVDSGCCIGCGVCVAAEPGLYQIRLSEFGEFQAKECGDSRQPQSEKFSQLCPFSGAGPDEDELANKLFAAENIRSHPLIGQYLECYVGSVSENAFRLQGSSGGMGTWVTVKLLESGLVDGIVHVHESDSPDDPLGFRYAISRSIKEVRCGAKSRYYPVEMSRVLKEVMETEGRYAIVGVPCFIKAVRRLSRVRKDIAERIPYCISLFCGHLKSTAFAEAIAWEAGVKPNLLEAIDFRYKLNGRPASKYGVRIVHSGGQQLVRPMEGLATQDWGIGLFKYPACDMCDDVVGETADISVGDAWLPGYVEDSLGTNVVIVRNPCLHELVKDGVKSGQLELQSISSAKVAESQAGGFRHRRQGLSYRLLQRQRLGKWSPTKRVIPSDESLTRRQKRIFDLRSQIATECRSAYLRAKSQANFQVLLDWLEPYRKEYFSLYRRSYFTRVFRYTRRRICNLIRWRV